MFKTETDGSYCSQGILLLKKFRGMKMGCLGGDKTKRVLGVGSILLIWNLPTCIPITCQSTKYVCVFHGQICNWREREAETMEKSENEREME